MRALNFDVTNGKSMVSYKNGFLFWLAIMLNAAAFSIVGVEDLIPAKTIQNLLSQYSLVERADIEKDYKNIRKLCFSQANNPKRLIYLATAGGPGASKSTILESYLRNHRGKEFQKRYCPHI